MNSNQYAVAFIVGLLSISSSAEEEKCYIDKDGNKVCEKCGTNNACGDNNVPASPNLHSKKNASAAKEEKRMDSRSDAVGLHLSGKAGDKSSLSKDRASDFKPSMKR